MAHGGTLNLSFPPFATTCISVKKSTATFFTLFCVVFVVCLCPNNNCIKAVPSSGQARLRFIELQIIFDWEFRIHISQNK